MTQSLDFAQGLSKSSNEAEQYWRDLYQHFNPPVNTTQSPDMNQAYGGGNDILAANADQSRARMAANGQGLGQYDPGMAQGAIASKLALQQMQQQHGMDLSNQASNTAAYQRQPVNNMAKLATIGGADQAMGRSTNFGELGRYLTGENINKLWDNYNHGTKDPLATAVGGFGGAMAGSALSSAMYPNEKDRPVNMPSSEELSAMFTPYYSMTGQYDKIGNKL